jgi:mono/diheme cytochrome c family protein
MRIYYLVLAALILCRVALIARVSAARAQDEAPAKRQLLVEGARLWPVYCAQCHNARPGSQFSPAQWDAITMHMKTLSNMPAKDMAAIREFLKEAR